MTEKGGAGRRRFARALLATLGLSLIAYLVRGAGADRVAHVLLQAGSWLPAILFLEVLQLSSDVVVLRMLLADGSSEVPPLAWVRSSAIAYAMMILVPAGRVAGEVARASVLAGHIGAPRAATASTQLQAAYLFANGALSTVACSVVCIWLGPRSTLALLLAGNALFMTAISAGLLAILWHGRVGRWLEALRQRFTKVIGPSVAAGPDRGRRVPWREAMVCSVSRCAQVVQYAVILRAVGGVVTVRSAFVAHGIHLVGATIGDMIPNQLGVLDGAYRTFAADLGFGKDPARALSIAFVVHIAQLLCATGCIVVAAVTGRAVPETGAAPTSARADARS
ncbi:MAG: lysylphosphatidylglycerol synthase domain-containing protein [Polyangiaceae bacterium]|jgi:hypothetical protein